MTAYSVADAKNRLPKLIDRALAGEEVVITRRGKPVAELRPASRRATPATGTHEWLRARTRARPGVGLTSVELLDLVYEFERGLSVYLDASVLLPTLIAEPTTEAVYNCLGGDDRELLISDFAAAEVASALSRLVRMAQLD